MKIITGSLRNTDVGLIIFEDVRAPRPYHVECRREDKREKNELPRCYAPDCRMDMHRMNVRLLVLGRKQDRSRESVGFSDYLDTIAVGAKRHPGANSRDQLR